MTTVTAAMAVMSRGHLRALQEEPALHVRVVLRIYPLRLLMTASKIVKTDLMKPEQYLFLGVFTFPRTKEICGKPGTLLSSFDRPFEIEDEITCRDIE